MSQFTSTTASDNTTAKSSNTVDDVTQVISQVANVTIADDVKAGVIVDDTVDHLRSGVSFSSIERIPPFCLKSLTEDFQYGEATQIQAQSIPPILRSRNILAQAQAGSGKTIAFVIGMLNQVDTSKGVLQAICIAPTRHLAKQIVKDAVEPLAKYMNPPCTIALAVKPEGKGVDVYRKGEKCPAQVVVGTAGSVKKWMQDRYLDPASVNVLVVDEADEMVKESRENISQCKAVQSKLPKTIQTLFFSATYPKEIMDLAYSLVGPHAIRIEVMNQSELILENILQIKIVVWPHDKLTALEAVFDNFSLQQTIIFCETKKGCDEVAATMHRREYTVSVIHGDIQNADEEFELFRTGKTQVLICTDILSRGIDVATIKVVVNYDVPRLFDDRTRSFTDTPNYATYLHRIGRCCRHGKPGTAITLVGEGTSDLMLLQKIERYYETQLRPWAVRDMIDLVEIHKQIEHGDSAKDIFAARKLAEEKVWA